ncbi:MAG: carbohydrate ABC transporter permease [Sedimentisphaerales bacterium]|jgi:multiple sugar transport system permease protein
MAIPNRGVMSNTEWRSPVGRFIGIIYFVVLVIAAIFVLFPFLFSFTAGFKTSLEVYKPGFHLLPEQWNWKNYVDAWQRFKMVRMFINTAIAAGGGVLVQIVVSAMAAYSLARLRPMGKNVIRAIILITMAVPGIAYLVPRYIIMTNLPVIHISLVNSFWGLWIPYACSSFMILVLTNAFEQIPKAYFEIAQVDGASDVRMFFMIALPLTGSLILVLGLLAFIGLWGDFLWPYLILRDSELQTVSVRLYTLTRTFPINLYLAGSFIAMLPPTIAAFFLSQKIKGGLTI